MRNPNPTPNPNPNPSPHPNPNPSPSPNPNPNPDQAQIVRNAQAAGPARLAILERAHLEPQLAPHEPVRSGWFGMGGEPARRLSYREVEP